MSAAMNRLEYLLSLEKIAQEQAEKWASATADTPPPIAGPAEWNWMNLAVFNATAAEDELKATEKVGFKGTGRDQTPW
ncbi:hypothetical protein TELCIR_03098 [Teladorsagia circumcincta]|uniref:Uncharacterized protein n=1 Tax=Teladorsagia circumcincta TaxID=45464 RepID=A0A2G9UXB5_TELCI|nr:hypothetical protein TELCIR_03098 [Teladorsagia circumcincta]